MHGIPTGDMNWIHINNVDEPVPLPPGWVDVWLQLRPEDRGWTYDTDVGGEPLNETVEPV